MFSFILPAYNEEKYIQCCIAAIKHSMKVVGLPYEIIVVNDGSSDNTKAYALKSGVRVITVDSRHLGRTRNLGAYHASGDTLVFVDADTMVTVSAIKEMVENSKKYEAGSTLGKYYDLNKFKLQKILMTGYTLFCRYIWRVALGYFMWCKKDKFIPFNENYYLFEDVWFKYNFQSFYLGNKHVLTSGRKAITHNFLLSLIPFMFKYALFGKKILKTRKHLSMWYDGKR